MKKLSYQEKLNALTNFLGSVTGKEELYIQSADKRLGEKFAIAERLESGTINIKSNFMTYNEMNCFFFGVLAVQDNRIKF